MTASLILAALIGQAAAGQATSTTAPPDDGGKVNAGSLYGPGAGSLFVDRTARKAGDLLTVLIDEQALSTFAAQTNSSKADSNKVGIKTFISVLDDLFKPLTAGTNSASSVSGQGSTQHTSRMTTRMAVLVKAVQSSGTLVIEGRRTLVTNKDTQTFVLGGLVRPQDITSDNTIRSAQIAEAEIRMEGKGMIMDRQRKGLITQVLDWLF